MNQPNAGFSLDLGGADVSHDILPAFDRWLAAHAGLLAMPMTIVERAPCFVRARFSGVIDAIEVVVARDEIIVSANHEGRCWDLLATFESAPTKVSYGVVCSLCQASARMTYPTREALYCDQVFRPFAEWIQTSLMPAHALGLGSSDGGGSTWATLLTATDERGYKVVIPLRK